MDSKQNSGQDSMAIELIQRQAEQVFGSKVKANHWLSLTTVKGSDSSRLQMAYTEQGFKRVKAELERLSHGFTC